MPTQHLVVKHTGAATGAQQGQAWSSQRGGVLTAAKNTPATLTTAVLRRSTLGKQLAAVHVSMQVKQAGCHQRTG
jgi:hypothetical protein